MWLRRRRSLRPISRRRHPPIRRLPRRQPLRHTRISNISSLTQPTRLLPPHRPLCTLTPLLGTLRRRCRHSHRSHSTISSSITPPLRRLAATHSLTTQPTLLSNSRLRHSTALRRPIIIHRRQPLLMDMHRRRHLRKVTQCLNSTRPIRDTVRLARRHSSSTSTQPLHRDTMHLDRRTGARWPGALCARGGVSVHALLQDLH